MGYGSGDRACASSLAACHVSRHGKRWRVAYVGERAARGGAAHEAVPQLCMETLPAPRSAIWIVSGLWDRNKVVAVDGLSPDQMLALLSGNQ